MKKATFICMIVFFVISCANCTYAGSWKQDIKGWWWDNGDGTYPKNVWQWCDGNNDGVAECYFFDNDGYCLTNLETPEGNVLNENGAWVINGEVQTKKLESTSKTNTINGANPGFNGEWIYVGADGYDYLFKHFRISLENLTITDLVLSRHDTYRLTVKSPTVVWYRDVSGNPNDIYYFDEDYIYSLNSDGTLTETNVVRSPINTTYTWRLVKISD